MVLILLRHGQSIWNRINVLAGWKDVPLSYIGKNEAYNAAKVLNRYSYDNIYTSDLSRAVETSFIIYNYLSERNPEKQIHAEISPQLKERHYGDLSGKKKEDLMTMLGIEQYNYLRRSYDGKPPNGESLRDVKIRVGSYFDMNIKPEVEKNKNVLIISHSNSLRALFVHLGLKDEKTIENFEIDNCVPIYVDLKNKEFYYESNEYRFNN